MTSEKWQDLRPRVLMAFVMAIVGGAAVLSGGLTFKLLVLGSLAAMIWELAEITGLEAGSKKAFAIAVLSVVSLIMVGEMSGPIAMLWLFAPSLVLQIGPRKLRLWVFLYGFIIIASCFGLMALRNKFGFEVILWLVALVAVSDIAGYFAGRSLGGAKVWPKVSPKKTWSGTVAGWIGAIFVGLVFFWIGAEGYEFLWLSPLLALSGQVGDMVQSALKRAVGVKDSSNLLPGHGGFLDRFDALIFAVLLLSFLSHLMPLPFSGV